MTQYILYSHDGSGNHGCEALVRSTIKLIDAKPENVTLVSTKPEEDVFYGIDQICKIIKKDTKRQPRKSGIGFWRAYYALKIKKDYQPMEDLWERTAVGTKRGDVAISIGGDVYCYGGTKELARVHKLWKDGGLKTVYWGCSIEPELLDDPEIAADIRAFDLITARECISYEALKKVNPNTVLVSDSAFLLEKKEVEISKSLEGRDLVGINLSFFAETSAKEPGLAFKNYQNLIEYILHKTDMGILLIPHVVWNGQNDSEVLKKLYDIYEDSGRIYQVEDCGCNELKGYIARCRFFVGARTHATIAAYSSFIPTLVVGYSVKARGIARDLFGTEQHYVLPAQELASENDLKEAFCWIMENESDICDRLKRVIPEYSKRVYNGVEALRRLG